ncbi:short-chain dehydrogenase reductase [Diplogelasinospora grovesii]|uniref:Short-chain dehydrogenase reductase n=1 Tax=Diplogelasinospora grovesii TaxID=303347 RepID=A0AAN6MUD3_9PEZI|nr:short-chain dehydrogenase reductase [Diplogelasinospora grovesii]
MANFDVTPEKRAGTRALLRRQFFMNLPKVTQAQVNLAGKTAIVTGSNTGIGLECCRQFLGLGLSRLILAVRSEAKGETAKAELQRAFPRQAIEVWKLDLSLYDSIVSFAERTKSLERLDIVVHNAGVQKMTLEVNKSTGHEEVMQVNYLSAALLTILLLPVLQEKNTPQQPGRLVIVNSDVAAWAKFKERDSVPLLPAFNKPEFFDPQDRYFTSKLLGQFFLSELVKRVPSSVAIVNFANPGLCYGSDLNREAGGVPGAIWSGIKRVLGHSTAVGARALVDAAVNHGSQSHGQYTEDGKIQPMAPIVYKPEGEKIAERLWQETMAEPAFARAAEILRRLSASASASA